MSDQQSFDPLATVTMTPADEERQARYQIPADIVVIVVFVIAYVMSRDLFETARWFPTALTAGGLAVTAVKLLFDVRRWLGLRAWLRAPTGESLPANLRERREASEEMVTLTAQERRELLSWILSVLALLVAIRLVGLIAATAVWLPLTLITRGKQRWWVAILSGVLLIAMFLLLEEEIGIRWPDAYFDIWEELRP